MKKLIFAAVLSASFVPALALACDGEKEGTVAEVTPAEGKALIEKKAIFVDANNEKTRAEFGAVPGAILLTNYASYADSELPADKSKELVFYCAAEQCGSSKKAAAKAIHAGWTSVKVMPAGIKGWKKAGNPTIAVKAEKPAAKQAS